MAREDADKWLRDAFQIDVASVRQAVPDAPGGPGGPDETSSGGGGGSNAGPSADALMKRAAAKAKEEADAAAAASREKAAALEQKRQAARDASREAEAKFGAEYDVETAARDAAAIAPSQTPASGAPSAAELLKQAEAKAKEEADAAGARLKQASSEFDQAEADAKAAQNLAAAKAKVQAEAEAAAAAETKASAPASKHIQPDCKPLRGKVAGPKEHVLCATHGHVYDEKTGLIIADSLKEYDAQHKVPRPMEPDCKIVHDKIPEAPKSIVLCATHEHVIDESKGQIIANTLALYRAAHPASAKAPAAAPPPAAAAAPSPAAKPQPTSPVSPNAEIGRAELMINGSNDVQQMMVHLVLRASGELEYQMTWNLADPPTGDVPESVQERISLTNGVLENLGVIESKAHKVEPGKNYKLAGKQKIKPVTGGPVNVSAAIIVPSDDRPILDLMDEMKITLPGP